MQTTEWYQQFGLKADPFAAIDESRFSDDSLYFPHPALDTILDDPPTLPRHHIIQAVRGAGKTALRKQFVNHYRHARNDGVLVVELTNWLDIVDQAEHGSLDLLRTSILNEISTQIEAAINLPPPGAPTKPRPRLRSALNRAAQFGRTPCFVVVDNVDNVNETADVWEMSAQVVQQLIGETWLLQIEHLGFKYFLPPEIVTRLKYRDTFIHYTLNWNDALLQAILSWRLAAYTLDPGGQVRMWMLAEPTLDDLDRIIIELAGSRTPREVFQLWNQLVALILNDIAERERHGPVDIADLKVQRVHLQHLRDELDRKTLSSTPPSAAAQQRPLQNARLPHKESLELWNLLTNICDVHAGGNIRQLMFGLPANLQSSVPVSNAPKDAVFELLEKCWDSAPAPGHQHPLELVLINAQFLTRDKQVQGEVDRFLRRVQEHFRGTST